MNELTPISEQQRLQGQMLQNVAVIPDGVELDFRGDKCGKSYRIKRESIGSLHYWQCFFYDWHDGWLQINDWPGEEKRLNALAYCNRHAVEKRLINFLPNRPKFKANPNLWGGWGSAIGQAASSTASVAAFGL